MLPLANKVGSIGKVKDKFIPFDPRERSTEIEELVMRGKDRLYYRFRPSRYYGGIVTADAIGCNFLCAYCWNFFRNLNPSRFKEYFSSQQVADRLLNIARRKSLRLFRISGAEPILGARSLDHLAEILQLVFESLPRSTFILETNGFILGHKPEWIQRLKFENLKVRVCLKGIDEESYERITGAKAEYFEFPLNALSEMEKQGMSAWPALMGSLFPDAEVNRLERKLEEYGITAPLEMEFLEAYPFVVENMKKRNIRLDE